MKVVLKAFFLSGVQLIRLFSEFDLLSLYYVYGILSLSWSKV